MTIEFDKASYEIAANPKINVILDDALCKLMEWSATLPPLPEGWVYLPRSEPLPEQIGQWKAQFKVTMIPTRIIRFADD